MPGMSSQVDKQLLEIKEMHISFNRATVYRCNICFDIDQIQPFTHRRMCNWCHVPRAAHPHNSHLCRHLLP